MTYVNASGAVQTKAEIIAAATEQDPETVYEIGADVYQRITFDGGGFEKGTKLLFHDGQMVKESDINALFKTATATAITPATGAAAGGTAVAITGTNLSGCEGVTFDGVAATSVVVVSNERITCVTPAHAAGAVTVVIKDDAGDLTKAAFYTFV